MACAGGLLNEPYGQLIRHVGPAQLGSSTEQFLIALALWDAICDEGAEVDRAADGTGFGCGGELVDPAGQIGQGLTADVRLTPRVACARIVQARRQQDEA